MYQTPRPSGLEYQSRRFNQNLLVTGKHLGNHHWQLTFLFHQYFCNMNVNGYMHLIKLPQSRRPASLDLNELICQVCRQNKTIINPLQMPPGSLPTNLPTAGCRKTAEPVHSRTRQAMVAPSLEFGRWYSKMPATQTLTQPFRICQSVIPAWPGRTTRSSPGHTVGTTSDSRVDRDLVRAARSPRRQPGRTNRLCFRI